jgi:hypothetical protein
VNRTRTIVEAASPASGLSNREKVAAPATSSQSAGAVSHSDAGKSNPHVMPRARRPKRIGSCDDRLCLRQPSKQVGDPEHVKALHAAETWFEENDPDGAASEYEVGRAN